MKSNYDAEVGLIKKRKKKMKVEHNKWMTGRKKVEILQLLFRAFTSSV